ncbi:MAG: MarR family transcriptional regulator [Chlamydiia bacterium]|nr:MarR family transcriptional regulator [Chlamydiia bacterium]
MSNIHWEKITHFEGPEYSPGFLLWQVSTKWRRQIEAALAQIGLTHPQFVLLASLCWLGSKSSDTSQVELARHCKTDITMTSQVLRTLEKKGYVHRQLKDGRTKSLTVTEKGVGMIEKGIPLVESIDQQFFERLDTRFRKFVEILQALALND